MTDFYDKAAGRIADHFAKPVNWQRDSDDYLKMKYGIDAILRNAVSILLLMLVGYFLGILNYVLVFMLTFGFLRLVSFGVHAPNPLACMVYGIIRTIGGTGLALLLAAMTTTWSIWAIALTIDVLVIICFWRYAPAETRKRPIPPGQRKRFARLSKVTVAGILLVHLLLMVFSLPTYANTVAIAMLAQAINLCPFMYRLFEKPTAS